MNKMPFAERGVHMMEIMATLGSVWNFVATNKEQVTLSIALLGAGLGVLNLWRDIRKTRRQERVRLEVMPKLGVMISGGMVSNRRDVPEDPSAFLVVEVINHSYFPVFIDGLYVLTDSHLGLECIVMQPSMNPKRDWPPKLERHESITLCAEPQTVRELVGMGARGVYIKTSAGQRFDGTSPVFDKLYAEYRKLPHTAIGMVDWDASEQMVMRS